MHSIPPFPFELVFGLIGWLLHECYCFLVTLVRYRIPSGTFDGRSWARMTLYHVVVWQLLGLPLTGMLFVFMRIADVVSCLPRFQAGASSAGAGQPFWAWPGLPPFAAWWLETLLQGSFLVWAFSPEGLIHVHGLFGPGHFLLYIFAVGFGWRCVIERLGTITIRQ